MVLKYNEPSNTDIMSRLTEGGMLHTESRVLRQRRFEDRILGLLLKALGSSNSLLNSIRRNDSPDEFGMLSCNWFNNHAEFPVALTCVAPPQQSTLNEAFGLLFKETRSSSKHFLIRNILEVVDDFPDMESALITRVQNEDVVVHTMDIPLEELEACFLKNIGGVTYKIQRLKVWIKYFVNEGVRPLQYLNRSDIEQEDI